MGNTLQYGIIFPIEWLNLGFETISKEISDQLEAYRINEKFNDAIITLGNTATVLQISDINMSWWFRVPGDRVPSPWKYHFMQNLLMEMYPDLEVPWRTEINRFRSENITLAPLQALQQMIINDNQGVQLENFMARYVKYEAIIPQAWLCTFTMGYIITAVSNHLNFIRNDNGQRYSQPIVTIGTLSAYLIINDEDHYWWFRVQTDVTTVPSIENYYFTGSLILHLCLRGSLLLRRQQQLLHLEEQQQEQHQDLQMCDDSDADSIADTLIISCDSIVQNSDGEYNILEISDSDDDTF